MREIKFRGKRKDNGEWVYGYLTCNIPLIFNDKLGSYTVYESTVGQYTGLKDKNGKEIYEGDKISLHQFLFDGSEYENELTGEVIYDNELCCFSLDHIRHKEVKKYMGYDEEERVKVPMFNFYGLHDESWEALSTIYDSEEQKIL